MKERELKLALPGRFAIPELTLNGEPAVVSVPVEQSLRATYYDTGDLRLARSGVTLRYRTGEQGGSRWALKLGQSVAAAVIVRDELHFHGPGREPPPEALSLVTAVARGKTLVAVATLRTRRRRMQILASGGDDKPVAELAIDEVSVVEGRRVVSRFRELEVEDLRGDIDLAALSDQLLAAGATVAEPIPKVVRALGSRATAPPDVTRPAGVDAPTMADALRFAIADALVRLVEHDPPARLGDPDGIHQVRVALRRLRSDLRTLGSAVDPAWRRDMEPSLRGIGAALAATRDLDVLIERVRAETHGSDGVLEPLLHHLSRTRDAARHDLRTALDAPAYVQTLNALVMAAAQPPTGPGATAPAATQLPAAAMQSWKRLERRADRLAHGSSATAFHRTRIAAKRARYAAELASRVLSGERAEGAAELGTRIADAQGQLGVMQDAVVAESVMRQALEADDMGISAAYEIGRLVEQQRRRSEDARAAFLRDWPKLRRRKWRRWAT